MAVLCVVAGAVLAMGQATVARHRAGGAADLAALAAADHWAGGQADACTRAERVARAQDTRVVRCVVVGEVSDVTAAAEFGPFEVEVRSRAGPAGPISTPSGLHPVRSPPVRSPHRPVPTRPVSSPSGFGPARFPTRAVFAPLAVGPPTFSPSGWSPSVPARPAFEDEAEGRQGARGEAP
ncbi:Rv3654c family TadE-like protein [Streptomyces aureocirculatus]|uniref:Rv3654c family TadE-like protein n=1 Tax=Streptomyces aureocirculatus TaxID=67275 RepID=UPI000D141425